MCIISDQSPMIHVWANEESINRSIENSFPMFPIYETEATQFENILRVFSHLFHYVRAKIWCNWLVLAQHALAWAARRSPHLTCIGNRSRKTPSDASTIDIAGDVAKRVVTIGAKWLRIIVQSIRSKIYDVICTHLLCRVPGMFDTAV